MPEAPRLSHDDIVLAVATQSREPFRDLLCELLEVKPDEDALKYFAKAHPDKYYKALSELSKIAGYKDEAPSGDTNIYMQIVNYDDMKIRQLLSSTLEQIEGLKEGITIEATE